MRRRIFFSGGGENRKEENIWRRSLQKVSKILRSLGFGLGLKTFANFWRALVSVSENLVSEKSFGFKKIGLEKIKIYCYNRKDQVNSADLLFDF